MELKLKGRLILSCLLSGLDRADLTISDIFLSYFSGNLSRLDLLLKKVSEYISTLNQFVSSVL